MLINTTVIFEQGIYFSYSYELGSRLDGNGGNREGLFNWAGHFQSEL